LSVVGREKKFIQKKPGFFYNSGDGLADKKKSHEKKKTESEHEQKKPQASVCSARGKNRSHDRGEESRSNHQAQKPLTKRNLKTTSLQKQDTGFNHR